MDKMIIDYIMKDQRPEIIWEMGGEMDKTSMDKTTEILMEAKRLLEEELEWIQGCLYNQDHLANYTGACAVGVIGIAAENLKASTELELKALYRLEDAIPIDSVVIPDFNDDPSTTKEDVLLAFKHAINQEVV